MNGQGELKLWSFSNLPFSLMTRRESGEEKWNLVDPLASHCIHTRMRYFPNRIAGDIHALDASRLDARRGIDRASRARA